MSEDKLLELKNLISEHSDITWYENNFSDQAIFDECVKTESFEKEEKKLRNILLRYNLQENVLNSILEDYAPNLIKAGSKGYIRGNKFNLIVKNEIEQIIKKNGWQDILELKTEQKHEKYKTSENPDWTIERTKNGKVIIGMNQIAMWGGGQQTNRADKYIKMSGDSSECFKVVSVIAKEYKPKKSDSKTFNHMYHGITENKIIYFSQLEKMIKEFFKLW